MSGSLKLVVHHGERARAGRRLAADALADLVAGAGVHAGVMLRGVEGFGAHHRLRTDRLLTLSDDLPLVTVAVGPATVVAPLATDAAALVPSGVLTLERVTPADAGSDPPSRSSATAKLTVACPRSAVWAVAAALRAERLDGVTALAGVDGVLGERRRRARMVGGGGDAPALVIAVGAAPAMARALARARASAAGPHAAWVERADVVRRAGAAVGPLPVVPDRDPAGLGLWQRMIVVMGPDGRGARGLVRDLRAAGCAGATALRGAWAAVGDGPPHADRVLSLRRRAPIHLTVVETPAALVRLWPIVEAWTADDGLVTCELLPAVRIHPAGGGRVGGLRLAATG